MGSTTELIRQIIGGPSDFGIGWLIILMASIIAILIFIFNVAVWSINKFRERSRFLETISRLDTGAHITYFMSLLGNPISINQNGIDQEYIFVSKYCYVQACANPDGKVTLFSVTTRRANFNPGLKLQFRRPLGIRLGQTNFSQLGDDPKRKIFNGDHGGITFYAEPYYFGYDGSYRTYFFSFNPNGYGKLPAVPLSFVRSDIFEDPEDIKRFRQKTIVNTYTVSSFAGPDGHKEVDDSVVFGPDYFQVRVFSN